jgi:hypothetical protein
MKPSQVEIIHLAEHRPRRKLCPAFPLELSDTRLHSLPESKLAEPYPTKSSRIGFTAEVGPRWRTLIFPEQKRSSIC